MEVRFRKGKDGRVCSWVALRRGRAPIAGPAMAAGGDIPHDLATFVIEAALGSRHGFWGCVAAGATFRSLRRKRTEPGKAVIRAHLSDLDEAETRVNAIFSTWRAGGHTSCNDVLDNILASWRALREHEELSLEWKDP